MPALDFSDIGAEEPKATGALNFDDVPAAPTGNALDFSDITPEPFTRERLNADIGAIGKAVGEIDNPVEMLRFVQGDKGLAASTRPESRDTWIKSAESQIVPQLQKALGIDDFEVAKKKLYDDPGMVDYGRELYRSFGPATMETIDAQISGGARFLGTSDWLNLSKYFKERYDLKSDDEVIAKMQQLAADGDKLHAAAKAQGRLAELTYSEPDELTLARRGLRQQGVLEYANKLDAERQKRREDNPDDPRIQGTNTGAFIEGIAQMPANLATAMFTGFRELGNYGQLYDEAYKQAKEVGKKEGKEVSDEDAHKSASIAALINTPIETASDLVLAGVVPKPLKDKVKAFRKAKPKLSLVAEISSKALTEGGTETLQQGVTNVATGAPVLDDAQQSFFGGVGGGASAGAVTGGIERAADAIAKRLEASGAKATAEAVKQAPDVAEAMNNLKPTRNYAQEQRQQLAQRQEAGQEIPTPSEAAPAPGQALPVGEESLPAPEAEPAVGETPQPEDFEGVPVQRVPTSQIASRPEVMQFKMADDPVTGTTEEARLQGEWDDLKAGTTLLWEPKNPQDYGLPEGQKYIVANGHYRLDLAQRTNTPGLNAQIIREADGFTAADARQLGAEINIADNKGTIYDQAKYLRNFAATHGKTAAADAGRRIGARGRQAQTIAFNASDSLFTAFINERTSPQHVEAIANASPSNEAAQRVGLRAAIEGKTPAYSANLARAAVAESGGVAQTGDLFGQDDAAIQRMEAMAQRATEAQAELQEQVTAVQSAARRPEAAARMGVDVRDPEGVNKRVAELKAEIVRWQNWPMHPDLLAKVKGDPQPDTRPNLDQRTPAADLFVGREDSPFNLVSETTAERLAREAREQAEAEAKALAEKEAALAEANKQQQTLFTSPQTMPSKYAIGQQLVVNGRPYTIVRDLISHVEVEAIDNPALHQLVLKDNGIPLPMAHRAMTMARIRLSNFLRNVGHPQAVYDGFAPGSTMYVAVQEDGEPRIFVNWKEVCQTMAGLSEREVEDRLYLTLTEEIVHVASIKFQAEHPELAANFIDWVTNPNNPDHDPKLIEYLRNTYYGYDQLSPSQKAHEAVRAIIQKRWTGTITEAAWRYLKEFLNYLTRLVTSGIQSAPAYIREYVYGIEDVLHGYADAQAKARGVYVIAASSQQVESLFNRAAIGEEAAFAELEGILRERYGPVPEGREGEDAPQRFLTPEAFERYFEQKFAEKDFDSILEAVKLSGVAIYQPLLKKLFKGQKDPQATQAGRDESAAKADWLRHVFSGTRPPDAKPRQAAPPPQPPGPAPTTPPRYQAQQTDFNDPSFVPPPPPPPPRPQGKHPFNMPALVYVARMLGSIPTLNENLRRARGRFIYQGRRIELHAELFKNPAQAARTLAHEIGHLFDFIAAHLRYGQLAQKVAPLRNWQAIFGAAWNWSGSNLNQIQQLLRTEAVALSRAWRGDFGPGDRYRNSANELYADFISALLNDPDWTFTVAPHLSASFFAGLEQKPDVEAAYNLVNEMLRSDTLLQVLAQEQEQAGRAAVQDLIARTQRIHEERSSLRRAWTGFYGGFLNKFGPTAQKAGGYWRQMFSRQQEFGTGYVAQQETEETYADRHSYLMHDRLWAGSYRPLQEAGIADTYLDRYLRNRRIIHERTATGIYLDQNPDEARELFKWMVQEGSLPASWNDEIDDATDAELYDLGARLVYALHEQQVFDQVLQAARRNDAPDFADRGLFAFDVSGFQMNPQGIDPENAQRQIDQMRAELGPESMEVLERAAENYYDTMRGIVLEANRIGLFRPSTWSERIEPNLNNYVPFMVIDYFTGHVDASVRQRRGTFRDVMPTHLAGQLKMAALLRRMQRQKQALLTQNFFRVEGARYGFGAEMTVHNRRLSPEEISEIEREGGGVIGFYDRGVWRWMQFEDGSAVAAMQQFDPDDLGPLLAIGRSQSNFWRLIFTTYSVAFTLWNALRTTRQVWQSHGTRNVWNLIRSLPEARNYARAVVRGEPLSAELRALVNTGALPAPDRSLAGQGSPELLERMILSGMISANNMVNRTPHESQRTLERIARMPLGWLFDGIAYLSGIVESAPKIATDRTLRGRGATPQVAAAYARLEGIPNPGISGKYNSAIEVALMFARVHIQGLRAFRTRALSPRTRGGFMMRAMLSQLLWKGIYVAAGAGLIDRLFGGDDEEGQRDWEEFVKRSTPYKLEMDDLLFLGWVKPDGGYEPPAGHATIPADWTPLTVRIPHSEDGRYLSPLSSIVLTTAFDSPIKPVDPIQRSIQFAQSFIPGSNPGFDLVGAAWKIGNDNPPQDDYRGMPIVDKDTWKAGYASRITGLSKHFMQQVGVPGFTHRLDNPDLAPIWKFIREVPGLGRLTPLDNYGGVREERRRKLEEERVESAARAMRGDDTKRAMYRLSALEDKGSIDSGKDGARNEGEEAEYQRLRMWHSEYYDGTDDYPGLFHTLRAKAAGTKDVDADYAKERLDETAREALEQARDLKLGR